MHRFRSWTLDPPEWRTQRNRLLPAEGGDGSTLSLDFTTGILDPRLTFTRSTNATFINSQGYVQYADANLIRQSESLQTSPWTIQGGTVQVLDVATTNPIGGPTSSRVTAGNANGAVFQSPTITSGVPHTIRFWIRAGTATRIDVGYFNVSFQTGTCSVVSGGTATISGSTLFSITNLTTTWTLIQIVLTAPVSGGSLLFYPDTAGTPTSGTTLFMWGVQMNAGTTASPYYGTTTTVYQAPRFDYDPTTTPPTPRGLLIEGSASNLFYWSESFETSGAANNWNFSALNTTRGTVTTTNPAGISTTVVKIQETNAAGLHAPLIVYSSLTSSVYTISAFVKAAERQHIQIIDNGGSGAFGMFNLSGSGSVVSESAVGVSAITKYPDNWYRIVVRTPTLTNINVQFRLSTDGTTTSYTGTTGSGVYIWGAQLEAGAGASSYIPSGASQGSRAEDTCYMDGTNFSSWYSASTQTGTLFADITHSALANANGGIELGNGLGSQTSSNRVSLRRDVAIVDGVSSITVSPTGASQRFKTAIAFAPGTSNTAACRNGGTVSNPAQAAGTLSGINALKFYIDASPALRPYGWIRQVKVWPTNLPNATLQALTTG